MFNAAIATLQASLRSEDCGIGSLRRRQRRRRIVDGVAVLAVLLGGIERVVGRGHQPVRVRADLPVPLRDPDRERNRDFIADAGLGIGAAHIQDAARDHRALAQGGGGQHDAELVAAAARQHVAGPQPRLRHQGEMLQAGVARGVAVGVVDQLEAVEIDHQQRERLAAAFRPRAFLGQPLQQMPPVADAGEIVEQREIGDLAAQPVHRHQQETEIERHRQEHHQEHDHR